MDGSPARKTTLGHMSRLMATAALASTVACSKCGSGPTGGGGYGVVDPMPMPARCMGGGVTAKARWVPKPGGGRLLEVDLSSSMAGVGFAYGPPRVEGGTLLEAPAPYPVTITPPPPTTAGSFSITDASAHPSSAGDASARAPRDGGSSDASSDGAAGSGADAAAGATTSSIGPTTGTFRIDPTSPTVHLVFESICTSTTGTLNISVSSGHTKDGGEELVTNVNET